MNENVLYSVKSNFTAYISRLIIKSLYCISKIYLLLNYYNDRIYFNAAQLFYVENLLNFS